MSLITHFTFYKCHPQVCKKNNKKGLHFESVNGIIDLSEILVIMLVL